MFQFLIKWFLICENLILSVPVSYKVVSYTRASQSRRILPNDSLLGAPRLVSYLLGDIVLHFEG